MTSNDAIAQHDARRDAQRRKLLALLHDGDLDGALQAGLMDYIAMTDEGDAPILEAQVRLRTAWDARERYRVRETRLARRAAERAARRSATAQQPIAVDTRFVDAAAAVAPTAGAPARPALPAAAAAALARARARAAGKATE